MAIDKIPLADIRAVTEAFFLEVACPKDGTLAALIDHSLVPAIALLNAWPGGRPGAFNLLNHLSGAEERVSPLLVELPTSPEGQRQTIAYLLKQGNGRPMFSILASPLTFTQLAAHLAHFTQIRLPPDEQEYLLRFADTRIVPTVVQVLSPAQRSQMFGPIHFWLYLDREAKWTGISSEGTTNIADGPLLTLTQAQLDAFERATMPDNFIAQLCEEFPGFAATQASARHRLVSHWISQANEAAGGRAEPGECLAYCKENLSGSA